MCIHRVTVLHRVTIVLAGALQGGVQLPSKLAFLLAGGHLSHTTVHYCTLYTVTVVSGPIWTNFVLHKMSNVFIKNGFYA